MGGSSEEKHIDSGNSEQYQFDIKLFQNEFKPIIEEKAGRKF